MANQFVAKEIRERGILKASGRLIDFVLITLIQKIFSGKQNMDNSVNIVNPLNHI